MSFLNLFGSILFFISIIVKKTSKSKEGIEIARLDFYLASLKILIRKYIYIVKIILKIIILY
jgi:hypothetical protein